MNDNVPAFIDDLQQRRADLGKEINRFKALQYEIQQLVLRSDSDSEAKQRLTQLQSDFSNGFAKEIQKFSKNIKHIEKVMAEMSNALEVEESSHELIKVLNAKKISKTFC